MLNKEIKKKPNKTPKNTKEKERNVWHPGERWVFAASDSEELSRLGKLRRWRSPRHRLRAGAAGRALGSKGWEGRKSGDGGAACGSAHHGGEGWDVFAED